MSKYNNCLVCQTPTRPQFQIEEFTLEKCPNCFHQSFYPQPHNLSKYYESEKYFRDGQKFLKKTEGKTNFECLPQYKTYQKRLNLIIKSFSKPEKLSILDVGCGTGLFVYLCHQTKIKAIGIDISSVGIKISRELGDGCFHQDFNEIQENSFSVVTMFDVLEHLPNPLSFLDKASRVLNKEGLFIFTTPVANSLCCKIFGPKWHLYTPPRHLHTFSTKSIRIALERRGFEIIKIRREGQYTNFGYLINKILRVYRLEKKINQNMIQKLGRYNINLYLNLFDVMTLITNKIN